MVEAVRYQVVHGDAIHDWWPVIGPYLETLERYRDHEFQSHLDYLVAIQEGRAFAMFAYEGVKMVAIAVMKVVAYTQGTALRVWAYWQAEGRRRAFRGMAKEWERLAREFGCDIVDGHIRADAVKLGQRLGYQPGHQYMWKEVR